MKSIWIVLAMLLAAWPALAQDAGDEPVLVEALVVNARTPGPAWWSVSKGQAKVWVLGVGVAVAANTAWDSSAFDRRLKASRRVIYADVAGKARFSKAALQADRPWTEELTDAERARLAQLATARGRPVDFYGQFRPNFAGMLIKSDLGATQSQSATPKLDLVARAKAQRAKLMPIKGRMEPGMRQSFVKGTKDDLACVRWVLSPRDQVVSDQARAGAWARGDVRTLVSGPMAYDPCVQSMRAIQTSYEANETALADAIAASLDKGDGAIALVSLIPLLRQGGVLDQLRAKGYEVRTPAALDADN